MNWLAFLLIYPLMVHNVVDFSDYACGKPYVNKLNCLITEYVEMLETCNHLHLISHHGCMGDKINSISLLFESPDIHTIDTARVYMLGLIDHLVTTLNQDSRIKPYLTCPFTADNVELRIQFVQNCLYPYPQQGRIMYMAFADGKIIYDIGNPRIPGELVKLREERLEFARRASDYDINFHSIPRSVL